MIDLCPQKKLCGSCTWSEIPYHEQLKNKLSLVNQSFIQAGVSVFCKKIIPSPVTSHYRNRMDFSIDYQGRIGLKEKGKWWKVIDDHTCFLADKNIEKLFHQCRDWIKTSGFTFYDQKSFKGLLEALVVRYTVARQSMINIVTSADFGKQERSLIERKLLNLGKLIKPTTLLWSINHSKSDVSFGDEIKIISGPGFIEEKINRIKYRITPNSFFQTNSYTAKLLQNVVLKMAKSAKAEKILDLYCGSGFFTIPLSIRFKKVFGVEVITEAVDTAVINAKLNHSSANFSCEKAEDLVWKNLEPDLVLVDPPRSGLHPKVINTLLEMKPKNIIYVSCNYQRFSEEMIKFLKLYASVKCVAVDMFPHTPHLELVTLLTVR